MWKKQCHPEVRLLHGRGTVLVFSKIDLNLLGPSAIYEYLGCCFFFFASINPVLLDFIDIFCYFMLMQSDKIYYHIQR